MKIAEPIESDAGGMRGDPRRERPTGRLRAAVVRIALD
jgi:hypothetical protein